MTLQDVYIHSHALVESHEVGPGTRIWAFAHVMSGAKIGSGCNICDHCFIEGHARLGNNVTVKNCVSIWDKVTIEDNVFIGPNAVFTNDLNPRVENKKPPEAWLPTTVRKGATIGANATVVCGTIIGTYAFIGAGAVVTHDVPDYALVIGVPGHIVGWVCRCGNRIRMRSPLGTCVTCGAQYRRVKSGLAEIVRSFMVTA